MKITVDKSIPDLTDEEKELLESADIPDITDDPVEFRQMMLGVKEVVFSPEVAKQLEDAGVNLDELVAQMLKESRTSN